MKKIFMVLGIFLFVSFICSTMNQEWEMQAESEFQGKKIVYVDIENMTGFEDGTQLYPYNSIQTGINMASYGDTVLVAEGEYYENIILNQGIVLRSEAGATKTKIRGLGYGDVVTGATGCTLQGFTITGSGDERYNCGVQAHLSTMTISENIITGNWLGINTSNYEAPLIQNNLIYNNSHFGIVASFYSAPTIVNNTIIKNGDHGISSQSGTGLVANNIIFSNYGFGIHCTMTSSSPIIHYNNVFKNSQGDYFGCIPGEGDISVSPKLKKAGGFFYLKPQSPCVNAGTTTKAPIRDINLEPRPQGGLVDIGCDEYVPFGTIYGFVMNEKTGLPLKRTKVKCPSLGDCLTKKDGYYGFPDVVDGMRLLKVSKAGFKKVKAEVDIYDGGSYRQDFILKRKK